MDKEYLRRHAREILESGPLAPAAVAALLEGRTPGDAGVIVQVSSGTTGAVLRIPRSPADVGDIARRVMAPLARRLGCVPERVAMIGGISHTEAAAKLKLGESTILTFALDALAELVAFDPVVISCYPSVARELLARLPERMPALRAFKLGGEKIFAADLDKLFRRFPELVVLEQFGSTEMPALALRLLEPGRRDAYELQTDRFRFALAGADGWQRLAVKDEFPELLFPVNAFYDTGDELLLRDGQALEVRRAEDPAREYYAAAEELLAEPGCVNVQFDPAAGTAVYSGTLERTTIEVNGRIIRLQAGAPRRIPVSNKLPLLAPVSLG